MMRVAGIIGGIAPGTELPLLLRDVEVDGLDDTTALHVQAIVERMFA